MASVKGTKVIHLVTGMEEGSGRRPFYDVTVFPDTGNVRFELADGTMYDHESSDLGFGETDPVRREHFMEVLEVTTMVRDDHPELFPDLNGNRNEIGTIPDDGNLTVIARMRDDSDK